VEASCGLYNLIDTEGAGEYQLRVSSQTCGGNRQQAFASRLTVNPSAGFTLRFHHRDHLGSSAVSRAYSPGFDEVVAGTEPFYLKVADGSMTLYAKPAKATLFDPYGEALGSVAGEPKPRYTDHEYDEASGLNYMKGHYQLANYAKLNRPDPMRDWDWENPHSINLYEYVRNNPISGYDPDGFGWISLGIKAVKKGLNWFRKSRKAAKVKKTGETAVEISDFAQDLNTIKAAANGNASGGAGGWAVFSILSELAPVSVSDFKAGGRAIGVLKRKGDKVAEKAAKNVDDVKVPKKTVLPDEAWSKNAPDQVTPGTKKLNHEKFNKKTGKLETSEVHYDEFGRQKGRTDYTDHGYPDDHTNPHHHKREFGPGFGPKGKETGPHPGKLEDKKL